MPDTNPGVASSVISNSQPAQIFPGTFKFANLPPAANMVGQLAGVQAYTTDQGMCFWNGSAWEAISSGTGQTAAESTAGVVPVNTGYPEGHLYRYGTNTVPGTTDMTKALNSATSIVGAAVFIPPHDTILIASNPAAPVCSLIYGDGRFASILTCGPAVTKCLSLTGDRTLRDFQISGNATASAVGIVFGDGANMNGGAQNVVVNNFTGTGAIGMQFGQCVKCTFIGCLCDVNTVGAQLDSSAMTTKTTPVTSTWVNCVFTNATNNSCKVVTGQGCHFIDCDFESATNEGLKIIPSNGITLQNVLFDHCWFEANNTAGNYMTTVDGSTAGVVQCTTEFRNCRWSTSGGTAFALHITGAQAFVTLSKPYFSSPLSGNIVIDSTALGVLIPEWDTFYVYATVVTDAGNKAFTIGGAAEIYRWQTTTARGSGNAYVQMYDPTGAKWYFGNGGSNDDFSLVQLLNAAFHIYTNSLPRLDITAGGALTVHAPTTGTHTFSPADIIGRGISICLIASAIEQRSSTTTLTNSTQLTYVIPGAGTYEFELKVYSYFTTAVTDGITANVNFSGTFTAVGSYLDGWFMNGTTTTTGVQPIEVSSTVNNALAGLTLATYGASVSSATPAVHMIRGNLIATATGTLAFAFAQSTSGVDTANLGVGSYMKVTQLS
jgi:hypothetical protein